jgi:hypothetical protein
MATAIDMLQRNTAPSFHQVSQMQSNTFQGGCSVVTRGGFRGGGRSIYRGSSYRGRGRSFRGGRIGRFTPSRFTPSSQSYSKSTIMTRNNNNTSIARGYSWNEWQCFSPEERQGIFQERDRQTQQQSRSVASMQMTSIPEEPSRNVSSAFVSSDDCNTAVSGLHAGQTRGVQQASLTI